MLHQFLGKLAVIAVYVRYQIAAQVVQLFDSWAGQLSPEDFKMFALPTNNELWNRSRQRTPTRPNPIHQRQLGY